MTGVSDLTARIAAERRIRGGWSQRDAADAGGVSNQTWSRFESTGNVTDVVRAAVMKAFGWPSTWPENPPPLPISENTDEVMLRLDGIETQLETLIDGLGALTAALRGAIPDPQPQSPRLPGSTGRKQPRQA